MNGVAERQRLRALVEATEVFRDALYEHATPEERDLVRDSVIRFADRVLHALARSEQGDRYAPYPHPIDVMDEIQQALEDQP